MKHVGNNIYHKYIDRKNKLATIKVDEIIYGNVYNIIYMFYIAI